MVTSVSLAFLLILLNPTRAWSDETTREIFARPLILGASISKGQGAGDGGPAALISKMINPQAVVTNLAQGGRTSVQSTSKIDLLASKPTVVWAIDLFFWDAVRNRIGSDFEHNFKRIFSTNIRQLNARTAVARP